MTFRQTDAAIAGGQGIDQHGHRLSLRTDHRLPSPPKRVGAAAPIRSLLRCLYEVVPMLKAAPELRAVAIFEEMQPAIPILPAGARRTLERRIRSWRALHGADQEVIFRAGP